MAKLLVDGALMLHGSVGADWFGDGFVATDVVQALAEVGRSAPITVRINSGGGIATEGAAIYAALRAHLGDVNVVIEGIAASAASIIAMGGDKITMRPGAVMMIHDPAGFTMGTVADHQKAVEALTAIADSMAFVYADRTKRTTAEERQAMTDETWMTADDAVRLGYADAVDDGQPVPVAAWNYGLYARAPQTLVAMARAEGWSRAGAPAPILIPAKIAAIATVVEPTDEQKAATAEAERVAAEAAAAEAARVAAEAEAARLAAEAAAQPAETAEAISARVTAAERDRARAIADLCKLAGMESRAGEMIAAGKTLEEARSIIQTARADAAAKADALSARHRVELGERSASWDKAVAAENAKVAQATGA